MPDDAVHSQVDNCSTALEGAEPHEFPCHGYHYDAIVVLA